MRLGISIRPLLIGVALALAGCGGGGDDARSDRAPVETAVPTPREAGAREEAPRERRPRPARRGTTIEVGDSPFGTMLFNVDGQAIYVFENDGEGTTACYGECARAWPPVFTTGRPTAGRRVEEELLGTIRRRDGRRQVTYAGRPLYFYAHEQPGEVRCHNVDLHGGRWWVVGPNGTPRP